jgi:sugar lactone lactonase YvrE
MYWSDTKAHKVYALDFEPIAGRVSRQRVFAEFAPREPNQPLFSYGGRPDGAAVDAEGCYWVAMFEGARVLRLSPEGRILLELRLPVRCPTMPCFGGSDLQTLYITTSRENRPAEELAREPWAGCVLQVRVGVPGLPANAARD